jgi:hypothetical protein
LVAAAVAPAEPSINWLPGVAMAPVVVSMTIRVPVSPSTLAPVHGET